MALAILDIPPGTSTHSIHDLWTAGFMFHSLLIDVLMPFNCKEVLPLPNQLAAVRAKRMINKNSLPARRSMTTWLVRPKSSNILDRMLGTSFCFKATK
jgi:hypothetical protein